MNINVNIKNKIKSLDLFKKIQIFLILIFIVLVVKFFLSSKNKEVIKDNTSEIQKSLRFYDSKSIKASAEIPTFGELIADNVIKVRTELHGKIDQVVLKEGSFVKNGDIIIKFENRGQNSEVTSANASLKKAEIEYKSIKKLFEQGLGSKKMLAIAEENFHAANSKYLYLKGKNLTSLKAPISGYIEKIFVKKGDTINAMSVGDENVIASIINFEEARILFHVSEKTLKTLYIGQKILFSKLYDDNQEEMDAIISFISKTPSENTKSFKIEAKIQKPYPFLSNGESFSITILSKEVDAHKIPVTALSLNDKGKIGVKIVDKCRVKFIPIEILNDNYNGYIIASGLPKIIKIIELGHSYVVDGNVVCNHNS